MSVPTLPRSAIALHEAGHAVVMLSLGIEPAWATVEPGPGGLGEVKASNEPPPAERLLIALGGPEVECRNPAQCRLREEGAVLIRGAGDELLRARYHAVSFHLDFDAALAQVHELLVAKAAAVRRIAAALEDGGRLSGTELRSLYDAT